MQGGSLFQIANNKIWQNWKKFKIYRIGIFKAESGLK
jgi:hypothetical protein